MSLRPLRTYVIPGLVLSLTTLVAACGDDGVGNAGGEGGAGDTSSSGGTKSSSRSASASQSGTTASTTTNTTASTSDTTASTADTTASTASSTATASTTASSSASATASSTSSGMNPGEICGDSLDNDMDSDIDCADSDCDASIFCNPVVINELDYDRNGADDATREFVELFNDGANAVVLDGVELLLVNGNTMPTPNVYRTVDLTGTTIAPGGFVVVGGASTMVPVGVPLVALPEQIQNGAAPPNNLNGDAVAIWDTVSETLIDAVSYENTVADADIHANILDVFETTFALGDLDLGNADPNVSFSINRFPDGTDTDDNGDDFRGSATVTPGAPNVITEHCSSTVDEDGDMAIDCADSSCSAALNCGEVCNDGIDNNANAQIDCQEASCDTQSCGTNGLVCAASLCSCPTGTTETCNDTIDNNCDGLVDCADPTCSAAPSCSEICTDGVDNNGNGDADCEDALCDAQVCGANGVTCAGGMCACPTGTTETCDDAIDNNCNGQVDCAEASCASTPACMMSCTPGVVISQFYGGGGNGGAVFTHDFVELHNRGAVAANIGGWSLQYTSVTGLFTNKVDIPAGTIIPAGGYFLVQLAAGNGNGVALPTADLTGGLNLSGTTGKLVLVSDGVTLGAACTGATVVDLVGFGPTANCSETAPTALLSNSTAGLRNGDGCTDTGNNSADFTVGAPMPRNSASPAAPACACN